MKKIDLLLSLESLKNFAPTLCYQEDGSVDELRSKINGALHKDSPYSLSLIRKCTSSYLKTGEKVNFSMFEIRFKSFHSKLFLEEGLHSSGNNYNISGQEQSSGIENIGENGLPVNANLNNLSININ